MFKDRKNSGEDAILIFDFLNRLVEAADTLEISEDQHMVLLTHFLAGSAADQYRAAANGSRSDNVGGIFHWLKAVQHLLPTYTTEQSITEAIDELNNIGQAKNKNDTAYTAGLNNAAYRCGNVHDENDKIYLYVNFLLPALTTVVQSFLNENTRLKISM